MSEQEQINEIKANPAASKEALYWLHQRDPLAAFFHPNCPSELWWELAQFFPVEALETPAGALFLLESPGEIGCIEEHLDDWILFAVSRLSPSMQHSFAIDCAERVLPLFARYYPDEPGPGAAVEARRRFAQGVCSEADFLVARSVALEASRRAAADKNPVAAEAAAATSPLRSASVPASVAASVALEAARDEVADALDPDADWSTERLERHRREVVAGQALTAVHPG